MPRDLKPNSFGRVLPRDHHCRTDDLAYTDVDSWWQDHQGRVPIQAAAGLSNYRRAHGCSFAEAWIALTAPGGPIILLDDGPEGATTP